MKAEPCIAQTELAFMGLYNRTLAAAGLDSRPLVQDLYNTYDREIRDIYQQYAWIPTLGVYLQFGL